MQPLSSSGAIAPAFYRTGRLLFRPFAWATFLRLCVAAVLAESVVVNFRYLTPHLDFGEPPGLPSAVRNTSAFIPLLIIAGLVAVDILLLAWYAIVRLRFVMFHALVYESPVLREGWRRYGKAADRLFRACLMTSLGIVVLVALLAVALLVVAFGVMNLKTRDGKYDAGVFLTLFFPTLGFAVSVLAAAVIARIVLHDFVLPRMALEGATFREAWRAVRRQIRADREGFFSYFLLRVLMTVVAVPVLVVVVFLVLWPLFWVLGASAAGYNALLDEATGIGGVGRVALNVVLLVLGAAVGGAGAALFGGPLAVFLRAHALYFYGSRYKPLGELLWPAPATLVGTGMGTFHAQAVSNRTGGCVSERTGNPVV